MYNPVSNTLEKIKQEKISARQAFIHDIPSAISYDIVKVGDRYGMTFSSIIPGESLPKMVGLVSKAFLNGCQQLGI